MHTKPGQKQGIAHGAVFYLGIRAEGVGGVGNIHLGDGSGEADDMGQTDGHDSECAIDRGAGIHEIMRFIGEHPESYASLAVCRRALDGGLDRVTGATLWQLQQYLEADASDNEIEAFYSIIS